MELQASRQPSDGTTALAARSERYIGVDVARVIACLGVIWLHTEWSAYNNLGMFRMPFYGALLALLIAGPIAEGKKRGFKRFINSRMWRILLPFVVWMCIYRIPRVVQGQFRWPTRVEEVLEGLGAIHLWFLPFALVMSIAVYFLSLAIAKLPSRARAVLVVTLMVLGIGWTVMQPALWPVAEHPIVWVRWLVVMPAVLVGMCLGFFKASDAIWRGIASAWPLWIALWLGLTLASVMGGREWAISMGTISGIALLCAGIGVPIRNAALWQYLAQLTFGMYLLHYGALLALNRIGFQGEGTALPRFAVAVVITFVATAVINRFRWGKLILGTEPVAKKVQSQSVDAKPAAAVPEKVEACAV